MAFVFNPIDPEFLANPYPTYATLRHEHPVYRHPAGFWVLSRYDDVAAALKNPGVFSSKAMGGGQRAFPQAERAEPPIGNSLISEDPPVHTQQRAIVNRGFTPGRIAALAPRVEQLADELVAGFAARGHCDLTAEFANPLPVSVIAELLGLDPSRRDEFKQMSTDIIIGSTQPGLMGTSAMFDSMRRFRAVITEAVEDRKHHPGTDLISALVSAEVADGILDPEATIGFAGLLLAAGSETTTNLIGNAMVTLLEDPALYERVAGDPSLVKRLLEESLRHDPPVQLLVRLSTCATQVGAVEIPANSLVMLSLGSANRDETRFPDPDRFDLERSTQAHLAFGFGNHFCLGASLARLEGTVAVTRILERLGTPKLAVPRVAYHGSFLIRGPSSLPIEFSARP